MNSLAVELNYVSRLWPSSLYQW